MATPIGVRIKNINGQTVIDDRFYNLMLRQKIVNPTVVDRGRGTQPRWRIYLEIPASPDAVIAYTCFNTWIGMAITSRGNTNTTRYIDVCSRHAAPQITVYVFDRPEFATLEGTVGLRIRNRITGEVAFDSRGKYMKILGFGRPDRYNDIAVSPLTFVTAGKIPAVVHVQTWRHNWSGTFDTGSGTVAESGEDVILTNNIDTRMRYGTDEWVYSAGGNVGGPSGDYYQGSLYLMFVDVTDL